MLVIAVAVLVLGRRSETVAGLLDREDERINHIDGDATVFAGMTPLLAVLVGFIVEIARGQDGQPYATLATIAGITYVVVLIVLRVRRRRCEDRLAPGRTRQLAAGSVLEEVSGGAGSPKGRRDDQDRP